MIQQTVNYLFVDGVQVAEGFNPPLDDCSTAVASKIMLGKMVVALRKQDFFYQIEAACKSVDGENVRLTN